MSKCKRDDVDGRWIARYMNGGVDPPKIDPPSATEYAAAMKYAAEAKAELVALMRVGQDARARRKLGNLRSAERSLPLAAKVVREAQRLIAAGTPSRNVAAILERRGVASASTIRRVMKKASIAKR